MQEFLLKDFISIVFNFRQFELYPVIQHSFDTAKTSALLAKNLYPEKYDLKNVFIMGLMHDIGLLIRENLDVFLTNEKFNAFRNEGFYDISFDMLKIIEIDDSLNLHAFNSYSLMDYLSFNIDKMYIKPIKTMHMEDNSIPYGSEIEKELSDILRISDNLSRIYRKIINFNHSIPSQEPKLIFEDINIPESLKKDILEIIFKPENFKVCFDNNTHLHHFMPADYSFDYETAVKCARIFSFIVDYRSAFTRYHSAGVAQLSRMLGNELFNEDTAKMLYLTGYFHDAGKIKVPLDILHKQGCLSSYEFYIMKNHVVETKKMLSDLKSLEQILAFSFMHHERLDGSGYPFGIKANNIPMESRIIQIADVFTALTEERPYRKEIEYDAALKIVESDVINHKLDQDVFEKLITLVKNGYKLTSNTSLIKDLYN